MHPWIENKSIPCSNPLERIIKNIKETLKRFSWMLHSANAG